MFNALNKAGKELYHELAVRQIKIVKTASKEFGAFINWLEPDSNCDTYEFLECLENGHYGYDAYETRCARENHCNPDRWSHHKLHVRRELRHDDHKLKKALKQLYNEMTHSFRNTMAG